MPGIDPSFICHRLAIYREAKPVSQKQRKIGGERIEAVKVETQKLLNAGFIKEIKYTTWLANVVMVKKSNGKWCMCVDYTDLNKACPKDAYPLPGIDRLVDEASGYAMLSFLDAYSSYNQILMYPPDEEYTAFITEQANYCYHIMPFRLKNAGATYQRLMDTVFVEQIGHNLEVYIDDMVIKTKSATDHVRDLEEILQQLRKYNMRLNPEKCDFGVQGEKFLGFMITCQGIEANPDKCQALINMRSPQNHKEVQRLAGRLASLSRFIPKMAELSEYGIKYESRGALKAQCLADFIAELTPSIPLEEQSWILHVDGSSNTKGSGAGIILEGPNDMMLELAIKFDFQATNNQEEYEALLAGLRLAKDVGVKKLRCCSDSKLITQQVGGSYQTKEPHLQRYNLMVSHLTSSFDHFQIEHVPRAQNVRADLLSKLASTKRLGQHKTIIQETISTPSYDSVAILANNPSQSTWMSNIWEYLTDGTLPSDKIEASKVRAKSCHFTIEAGELFKRGFSVPLLKCLDPDQAEYVMSEIHRGICGMHSRARSMAARVIRAGYYWPTMRSDCKAYVQKCEAC
uniref:Transposon Ty3-G Gag-Pol polyprotein n=1 Tax=Cajanus cajan TaxID=3821 RepID=A0A151QNY4_CAJCA|nr:Transposon Ty3-G Gag-Pol polyprotein [Cajanus cajan]